MKDIKLPGKTQFYIDTKTLESFITTCDDALDGVSDLNVMIDHAIDGHATLVITSIDKCNRRVTVRIPEMVED